MPFITKATAVSGAQQRADRLRHAGQRRRLHGDDDGILHAQLSRAADAGMHSVAAILGADGQAIGGNGLPLGATRHHGCLGPAQRQARGDMATDGAGAEYANSHRACP
jgi:hypothetical protein